MPSADSRPPIRLASSFEAWLEQCSAYDLMASMVAVVDTQGALRYANPAFSRFNQAARYSAADLQRHASLLASPELQAWLLRARSASAPQPLRHAFFYAPRIQVTLTLFLTPLVTDDDRIAGGMLTLGEESIDFDHRHLARAQEAHRTLVERIKTLDTQKMAHQQLLTSLLKDAPVAMVLLNARREIIQLNHAAAKLFETNITDLRGLNCESVLPCFRQCGGCPALDPARNLINEEMEILVAGRCLTLLRSAAVAHQQGDETMIVEAFVDLTQRKEAEEEYHTILRTALDGFWIADKNGQLIEVNEAYCQMSGYPRDELLQMHIADLEAQESAEMTRQHIEKIIAQGGDQFESKHRRKDGAIMDVEISTRFLPSRGGIFVVFVKDITERKSAETQLRRAMEEADAANMAKSVFLSNVSHELRTPLNAILGFSQLLQEADLPVESRENIDYVYKAGKHLLTLINEILDLTKIEAGKMDLNLEPTNIDDLIRENLELVMPLAERHAIKLAWTSPAERIDIQVDRTRLSQVILNLLSNAIKYNRAHGRVSIHAEKRPDDLVRIVITDTGIGLSPENLQQVFQPFTRMAPSHIEGTGIGLTISRKLVEFMGGSIGALSEPGVGSTFWIDVKQAPSHATHLPALDPAAAPASTTHPDTRQAIVLYIDDYPENLTLLQRILKTHCTHVELLTADDPYQGLDLAKTRRPDLILLDITMPGMDGYETLKRLRADQATSAISVVAVTANAMPHDIEAGKAAGFDDYLTKPIHIPSLLALINRHPAPATP